ncbi:hypothetical protein VN12_14820 [Pirellula sp. SH-Sr6A]|nr:hypothetical protein VN12_14820 [Pirellula sp. SH-Sr6A]
MLNQAWRFPSGVRPFAIKVIEYGMVWQTVAIISIFMFG